MKTPQEFGACSATTAHPPIWKDRRIPSCGRDLTARRERRIRHRERLRSARSWVDHVRDRRLVLAQSALTQCGQGRGARRELITRLFDELVLAWRHAVQTSRLQWRLG